jgi:hypothetical protein
LINEPRNSGVLFYLTEAILPTNEIKKDAREGKGTVKSLEHKWDKAKDASKKSTGKKDDWALTNYIYQKERDASVQLNAANRLEGSCPICAGIEGCDHTKPERTVAAFPKSKRPQWMAEYEKELTNILPHMHGKVDWDTATYFFNQGLHPKEAAIKFAESHSK